MKRGMLLMSRLAILASAALLLSAGRIPTAASEAGTPTSPAAALAPAEPSAPQARIEVRLRKLHLVRPDLIPYPIHYDVYC